MFSTGGKQFFNPTLVYSAIWRGGKRFYQPTLVPFSRQNMLNIPGISLINPVVISSTSEFSFL
jgi:hypothetical protein